MIWRNAKLDLVQVCPFWGLERLAQDAEFFRGKRGKEELRRGNLPGYHLLNRCELPEKPSDFLVIDFRMQFAVQFTHLKPLAMSQKPRLRLLPPYREHLAQALARFYCALGCRWTFRRFERNCLCGKFQPAPAMLPARRFPAAICLRASVLGFGWFALNGMMAENGSVANASGSLPHHRPRAKNVIFCFMDGGVSHVDSFDPKPELDRARWPAVRDSRNPTAKGNRQWFKSPWTFRRCGQSGMPISDLFPHIAPAPTTSRSFAR